MYKRQVSFYDEADSVCRESGFSVAIELMRKSNREKLFAVMQNNIATWKIAFIVKVVSTFVKDQRISVNDLDVYKRQAINAAKKCHKSGIEVIALGFGSADHVFLKKIASTDEFASITDLSDLGGSFSKIAQAIGEGSTGLSVF